MYSVSSWGEHYFEKSIRISKQSAFLPGLDVRQGTWAALVTVRSARINGGQRAQSIYLQRSFVSGLTHPYQSV